MVLELMALVATIVYFIVTRSTDMVRVVVSSFGFDRLMESSCLWAFGVTGDLEV